MSFELELSEEQWKSKLSPARYAVLRESATEAPWTGEYLHIDENGTFLCAGCGASLFSSTSKFDSGCGWPSFDRALHEEAIIEREDRSGAMVRTEIICSKCGGHLGHVFPDGPTDTGLRYCVNSLSLDFES